MNIFALIVTLSLNCFATKAKQMKTPLALAVTKALNEYSPLAPLFLRVVKGHPPRLEEVPPVAHALPQAVVPAKCSSLTRTCKGPKSIEHYVTDRPVKAKAMYVVAVVS
jgi:hypothetical protein